jgi:NADPH-dependent 7-cyano-7-deazaguanine reductase QueF-like protein
MAFQSLIEHNKFGRTLLFSVVRTQSLTDIGIQAKDSLEVGLQLLNWQMYGLLLGALC